MKSLSALDRLWAALIIVGGVAAATVAAVEHFATASEVAELRQTTEDKLDWLIKVMFELARHPDDPQVPPPPAPRRSK